MNFITLSRINSKALNLLVLLYPLTLLTGNFLVNTNVFLICLLGILNYKKNIFSLDEIKLKFLFFLFFLSIIITTIFFSKSIGNEMGVLKSFLYLRYFVFFLVLKYMIENNDLDIKRLLICCLILTSFISLDVTFQTLTGKNFFGFEGFGRHNSSIFGQELIAGSYIQKFFLFSLVCLIFLFDKLDNRKLFIIGLFLSLFFLGILLSGNRMPLVMFLFSVGLMIILIKELRQTLLIVSVFFSLIFTISIFTNEMVKANYSNFYMHSISTIKNVKKLYAKEYPELEKQKGKFFSTIENLKSDKFFMKESDNKKDSEETSGKNEILAFGSGHQVIYLTAIDIWLDKVFLGNGLKSFRLTCKTKLHLPNRVCESHPHNYYLELLNDTGLIGTFIFILLILFLFISKISNFGNLNPKEKFFLVCILIAATVELFPLKSTGAFFSTANSSYIFFLLGLLSVSKNIEKKT